MSAKFSRSFTKQIAYEVLIERYGYRNESRTACKGVDLFLNGLRALKCKY